MLRDFFILDSSVDSFDAQNFTDLLAHTNDFRNFYYTPTLLPSNLREIEKKSFTNVGFSKAKFRNVTFRDCLFEDCLFVGTEFTNMEFHRCRFINCNFYKVKINKCYWDPSTIYFDSIYKKKYANIGLALFQSLMSNATSENQPDFIMFADIEFRKWKRSQLFYDRQTKKYNNQEFITRFLGSYLYQHLAGFGYRPFKFFTWTIVFFLALSYFNMKIFQNGFKIDGSSNANSLDYWNSVFYTFSISTSLGLSSIVPATVCGKLIAAFESLIGISWLAVFTSILVKRILK